MILDNTFSYKSANSRSKFHVRKFKYQLHLTLNNDLSSYLCCLKRRNQIVHSYGTKHPGHEHRSEQRTSERHCHRQESQSCTYHA